ncbi:PEPxxWA-CTERM sorting domain-containing protein [Sphingomonas sp. CFBP 8760]|nr:PEPxxWA-CTERM sorting domain-containing protein [Sphingomonas sp. CFBP 8760]
MAGREMPTWAMMLVGFGMVGATARYRRRPVRATYA